MLLDDYDEFDLNYDLDKVPKHDLPNPLIFKNGFQNHVSRTVERCMQKRTN